MSLASVEAFLMSRLSLCSWLVERGSLLFETSVSGTTCSILGFNRLSSRRVLVSLNDFDVIEGSREGDH